MNHPPRRGEELPPGELDGLPDWNAQAWELIKARDAKNPPAEQFPARVADLPTRKRASLRAVRAHNSVAGASREAAAVDPATVPLSLVEAWQRFNPNSSPRLLPGDEALGTPKWAFRYPTYEAFVESPDFGQASPRFHLELLPQPFIGHLTTASVFLLLLNPGFSPGDYYAQQHAPAFAAAKKRNLAQQNGADPYPFFYLDPQFAWTAGGQWWQARLRSVADELVAQNRCTLHRAYAHISRHTACLELFPYHSRAFTAPKVELESTRLVRQYVGQTLVPRALAGDAVLVATRQIKAWQAHWPAAAFPHPNIVAYSAGQARGAHLSMQTPGGQALQHRLQALWTAA